MKLPKAINNPKVKKIVDVASSSVDEAVLAIKDSGIDNAPIISNIVEFAGLKKKRVNLS